MDKTFQMQVNSAPQTKLDFPVGTRIFIESISDGSYPNAVGKYATVLSVDDTSQIKVVTDSGNHATVCKFYGDVFRKVEK